ncbi:hypothetical protein BKI52_43615 [marine bacterium AO1-C]|nr:hypothetical protein BKI52_43615 [marine bacterium AO1-C]
MKKTLSCLSIWLIVCTLSTQAFAQKSGKFYAFTTKGTNKKAKVVYNSSRDRFEIRLKGMRSFTYDFKRETEVTNYKGSEKLPFKAYYGSGDMFYYPDGSILICSAQGNKRVNCDKIAFVEKDQTKKAGVVFLSQDKGKVEAMNKEKITKMVVEALQSTCKIRRAIDLKDIAKMELPKEGMKNAKLLAKSMDATKAFLKRRHWKEVVVGGYLFSKEWKVIRNKNTGIILGRRFYMVGLMKKGAQCKFGYFTIRQNFNGSTFNEPFCEAHSRIYEVTCDKMQKKMGK